MQIGRALTASMLMALLFLSGASAVEYDFILNESSRSYRTSFSPTDEWNTPKLDWWIPRD